MKEFTVKVTRTLVSERVYTIKCEDANQAECSAFEVAQQDDWSGTKSFAKYDVGKPEEVPNDYIDQYGNPYDPESDDACWPAGGGLHKDCEFNADALYAYYTLGDRYEIEKYLRRKGFKRVVFDEHEEVWTKGNTEVTYEDYDNGGHLWGYMHTELIEG
jgi:hypothetical protein